MKTNIDQWSKYTLMQDKTRFEQKSRQKRKPNAVLEKENNR
jgi:hypothetical protein